MRALTEWPLEARRATRGVLTDIDDTLTTHGQLTPAVLDALSRLRAVGFLLVAVTGRPTYWALPLLRLCGLHAVIAENGASAFWLDAAGRQQALFYADMQTRRRHREELEAFAGMLSRRFPEVTVADDAAMRVGDLAFDIGETIAPLPPERVEQVLGFIRAHGFHATASSIHAHASKAPFSKQAMSERVLREVFGIADDDARATFVFVGDSGNDASMFAHYPHSIGVANIARYLAVLPVAPAYLTREASGAGFVELAQCLLEARASEPDCAYGRGESAARA
ncbi:MAG TPA: HAD-IIB family hydrolase [Noviherbaspirillum sp.]|nr:HAD-IIB family hydrolase [Noviherbaspirillum sp.]